MKVILPDNSERVFEGVNAMDPAKSIGKKLAKAAVAAEVNGEDRTADTAAGRGGPRTHPDL